MIYRINEFKKSVSTLFYHLRATSLCFGDAHCSVTSDKSNISTRFLCNSTVYQFSLSLMDYPRYIENYGDRPTNQLPTYLRIDRLKVSPHKMCQNGHRGYICPPRWQHETLKCKRYLTNFKLCSTLSREKFRTFAHATTPWTTMSFSFDRRIDTHSELRHCGKWGPDCSGSRPATYC